MPSGRPDPSVCFDIWSPDGGRVFQLPTSLFIRSAWNRWKEHVEIIVQPGMVWDAIAVVEPDIGTHFDLCHAWDQRSVGVFDLGLDEVPDTAAWVRSLLPDDPGGRIWVARSDLRFHADLPAGVTPEQVAAGWIEHQEPDTDICAPRLAGGDSERATPIR